MPKCVKGVEENERARSELANHQLNIRNALRSSFGHPVSNKKKGLIDKYKSNKSAENHKALSRELNREKAHKDLLAYLEEWIFDHTTIGEGYGEIYSSKIRLLQGIHKHKIGLETGNLQYATEIQINNIHALLKKTLGKEAPTRLNAFDNSIGTLPGVAIKHDKSGHALNVIERSTSLSETVKRLGVEFVDRIEIINKSMMTATNVKEGGIDNEDLVESVFDAIEGKKRLVVRGFIPTTDLKRKMFAQSSLRLKDQQATISTDPDIRHKLMDEDGNTSIYKMLRITGKEVAEYNNIYETTYDTNAILYVAMPMMTMEQYAKFKRGEIRNKVVEGWHEASDTTIHQRVIKGTKKFKESYSDFRVMEEQLPGFLFRSTNANNQNFWDSVHSYEKLGMDFYKYFDQDFKQVLQKLKEQIPIFERSLEELYAGDEDLIIEKKKEMVDALGMHSLVSVDDEGNIKTAHTDLRYAENHVPTRYLKPIKIFMMHDKKMELEAEIDRLNKSIDKENQIIKKGSDKILPHVRNRNLMKEKVKELTEQRDHFFQMIRQQFGIDDYDSGTMQVNHAMSRSIWTDKMLSYRGSDLYKLYIDDTIRSLETNKLKIDMMGAIINTPEYMHDYLVDQVRQTQGGNDAEAMFMNFDYSDKKMIERLGKIGVDIDPHFYEKMLSWHRGIISGFNLSWYTAFTNNFQRFNYFIDYGFGNWAEATAALLGYGKYSYNFDKKRMDKFVDKTGVKDPIVQFTDIIIAGAVDNAQTMFGAYTSMRDLAAMKRGDSPEFDKVLIRASGKEKIQLEELQKLRDLFYKITTTKWKEQDKAILEKSLKELEWDLTDEYIGRIVNWRLSYFPVKAGSKLLTMRGTEIELRSEGAVMGFINADKTGQLDHTSDVPLYEQENAIKMARGMVYHTQFAFDPTNSPKMFRGAFGRMYWQFKQYQYFQASHDWKIMKNLWDTSGGNNAVETSLFMSGRVIKELGKMVTEAGYLPYRKFVGKDNLFERDDIAQSFIKFSIIRGLATAMTTFYQLPFFDLEMMRTVRGAITGRGLRGLESPLLVYPARIAKLGFLLSRMMDDDDEDKERTFTELIFDWFPAIINVIVMIALKNPYAFSAYVPPGAKVVYKGVAKKIEED